LCEYSAQWGAVFQLTPLHESGVTRKLFQKIIQSELIIRRVLQLLA